MLKMPMKWFDISANSPGALSSKLAVDAEQVNGLSNQFYGLISELLGSLITGFAIGKLIILITLYLFTFK